MQEAYIVAGYRTAVGKAKRGGFRFYRPDDLAIDLIRGLLATVPQLDKNRVDASCFFSRRKPRTIFQ